MRRAIAAVVLVALIPLAGCKTWQLTKEWQDVNSWARTTSPHFPGGEMGHSQATTRGTPRDINGVHYDGYIEIQQIMSDGTNQIAYFGLRTVDGPAMFECGEISAGGAPTNVLRQHVNQYMENLAQELRNKYPAKTFVRGHDINISDDYLKLIGESQ